MKHKESRGRNQQQVETAMFAPSLLLFALLATCSGQSGLPRFFQDPWGDSADASQSYYDPYGPSAGADLWPAGSAGVVDVTVAVRSTPGPTRPPPHTSTRDSNDAVEESAVWKVALVVAVLLASVVGSLSMAYYLCFWRGGRIYYQPQKEGES